MLSRIFPRDMFTFEAHQSILILYFVFWNLDFVFSMDNLF